MHSKFCVAVVVVSSVLWYYPLRVGVLFQSVECDCHSGCFHFVQRNFSASLLLVAVSTLTGWGGRYEVPLVVCEFVVPIVYAAAMSPTGAHCAST